jgi:outer membrane immunogenic protein
VRLVLAICALLAITGTARAADPTSTTAAGGNAGASPVSALPYDWAGFYIRGSGDLAAGIGQASGNPLDGLSALSPGAGHSTSALDSGAFGANWQAGETVVGFQGDMQWANQWTGPFSACGLGCSLNDRVKVPWLATLRARAGTTFDRVFVYGTGGLASSGTSSNLNAGSFGTTPDLTNFSTGNIDWTIGAGMEMALDKNVSAKLEYLYMPNGSPLSAPSWLPENGGDTAKNNVLRGGIDYRLPIGGE